MANFFDIELIDINENIDNFSFDKVSEKDLYKIINSFKNKEPFLEFKSLQGVILLEREHFRGIMQIPHKEKKKTAYQETIEAAKEVLDKEKLQIKLKKPKVFKKDQ